MSCDNNCIERDDFKQIVDRLKTGFSSELFDSQPVKDGSPFDLLAVYMAGILDTYKGDQIMLFQQAIDPTQRCCEDLIDFARRRGMRLKPPAQATGYVKITGNAGQAIPSDIEFVGDGGLEYALDKSYDNPIEIGVDQTAVLKIMANEPGAAGNINKNGMVTLASYPGIDTQAVLVGNGLAGGADQETCDQLRERVRKKLSGVVMAENADWYEDQILSYPGVTRVCMSRCCNDCGDEYPRFFVFMDGIYPDGIPPCEVRGQIEDYIWGYPQGYGKGKAGFGAHGYIMEPKKALVDIDIEYKGTLTSSDVARINLIADDYFRNNQCLDEKMCIQDLMLAIRSGMSDRNCIKSVKVSGNEITISLDGVTLYPDCGYFPAAGTITTCQS